MLRRRFGEAQNAAEHRVESAILRVPNWTAASVCYVPLVGGLQNQNWKVEVDGHPRGYFVKVPGIGTELFINRTAANEAARNAHALGLGPEVIFFDPSDGIEVSEFLDNYRACTNADFQDATIQNDVLGIYRRFHGGPQLGLTKTIFDMIEEHLLQAREFGAQLPEDIVWLEHRYRQAKAALEASGLDLVPCFNDPMPGNFLVSEGRPMKLIDYEFASNNERSYELGVLFGEMFFDEALMLSLIESYYGSVQKSAVARVFVNRALADIKWATWAVVTRKISAWDFDYQKYGVWKYMRARSLLNDPRWDTWLRNL